jgi:SAM-dependent methyltransferase
MLARGFEVAVMMTESARKFVTVESLAAITHRPVLSSFWAPHDDAPAQPAPHIQMSQWAELVVVYPASAATLARVATGATEDLVAATVVATRAPVILAPSMNDAMYRAPSVQRNLAQLREDGFYVVQPRFGVEVATAPEARTAIFGAAHAAAELMRVVELVWASAVAPQRAEPIDKWERQYASVPLERQPFYTDALDDDIATALTAAAKAGARRLLDIGTGPGTTAIFAAQHGFDVVASDLSATALMQAKRRAQSLPIAWLLDDIAASRLWGQFDVVVDRGCLHALPRAQWPNYAAEVARRVVAGGQLVLKQHALAEGTRWGTQPLGRDDLEPLFGADFTLVEVADSHFAGTAAESPSALFARLIRR